MNQIAGVDGFNIMNNLRLVVIVAIFIVLIIVLFLNRILGSRKKVKQKDMQAVNQPDVSNREERDAHEVVGDFFDKEESTEKEISKGGESASVPEVEIENQPSVNYEKIEADLKAVRDEVITKIEADLKAVRDEVTTKIEGLILKVEAVEKEVLSKIEDVIDEKIQEASNKINDRISEAVKTQINSINPVSEEMVASLRKEVLAEIKEKEQTDAIVPSGEIEEEISGGDVEGSIDSDIQNVLEEEPVSISSTEEPKESAGKKVEFKEKKEIDLEALLKDRNIMEKFRLFVMYQLDAFEILPLDESKTVAEEKKERDIEVPSEVKKDVKVDEKVPIEAITPTGEIEDKISEGGVGKSVGPARLFFQKFLSAGISSTEEPKESAGKKVGLEEKKERDLEASVKDSDILEKLHSFVRNQLDAFGTSPSGESKTVAEEKKERGLEVPSEVKKDVKVDKKETIEANTSTGEVEEKKEGDLETSVEDRDILEKLAGSLQMNEDSFDILPSEESKTVAEEKEEIDLEIPSEVKEDVKVEEKEPIEANTSTGEIEEKISEGDAGESIDLDIEKLLEEEPVGMSSTEESREVEENVESKEEKEEDLELPAEETVAHEGINEKEIDTITPPGDIKEKTLEAAKGEEAEKKKQSTEETVDFDIQEFLEELGTPPSEEDLESEKK